ncbi:MAG: hypothetical protein ACRCVV_10650 [Shewanella sp.]
MSLHDIFASVTGNENLENGVEEQIEATVEAVVEAQVAAEIAEAGEAVAEAEADIQKAEVAIEALEEKVEELEEVVEGMESMLSGATPFNAALFHDQYKRAAKVSAKFGQPTEVHGVESFADASTASLNALAGVESFKENAAKGVAAVKKFFVDLYNGFINFFAGILNKFKGLENRAKSLKEKVTAKEKLAEKVKLPKSAGWISADGAGEDVAAVMTNVVNKCQAAMTIGASGTPFTNIKAACEELKDLGKASQTSDSEAATTFKVVVEKASFSITVPKKTEGLAGVSIAVNGPGEGADVEIKAKDKEALNRILVAVMVRAKTLQFAKLDRKALEANRDASIAKIEKLAAEQSADKKAQVAEYRNGSKAGLKLQQGGLKISGVILSAQLDYVAAHV